MNEEIFSDIAIEKTAARDFGRSLEIARVIIRDVPVSAEARATLFLTSSNALYLYVTSQAELLLADVKKIVRRMGLEAHQYVPPAGSPDYFEFVGRQKFHEVFPSRPTATDEDLAYYKTLAPYNPGLVRINRIKNSEVYGLDLATKEWHKVAEYRYTNIKAIDDETLLDPRPADEDREHQG